MKRLAPWIPAVACALVAVLVWRPLLDLSLLGWDSYPMIAAGKVSGLGEVFATFGEELMDGRYPLGRYWRPLVHLSFALDHALWGLDPFGYHLSDLVLLAAGAGLTAALAVRLLELPPRSAPVAGLVAGLAFALHPVHFEILPVAPRRADALAVLFTLLALHVAGGGVRSIARALLVGLICAAAFAAKETGVVALAAVALLVFVRGPDEGPEPFSARCARTARALWPALVPVAAAIAARTVVLGGLGGGIESSLTAGFASLHLQAAAYVRRLSLPPTWVQADQAGPLTLAAAAAALVFAAVTTRRAGRSLGRPFGFLAGWAFVLAVLTSMSGLGHDWYLFPFLPLWGLGLGLLAGSGLAAIRPRDPLGGVVGLASLALAATLVLVPATASPLGDEAEEFHAASTFERRFLEDFEREARAVGPGGVITVERFPVKLYVLGEGEQARTFHREIYILGHYSLEAWGDLVLGPGTLRVHWPGASSKRPGGPGVIDVNGTPVPMGFRPTSR
jgi:hypothetical protein